jgi:hypothetical protein
MTRTCSNCKYAREIEPPVWTEEMEESLQKEIDNHEKYVPYSWMTSYFWRLLDAERKDKLVYITNHLECRRFPRFEEKKNDDCCGEWKGAE